jgi:hypothetical protein
LLTPIIFLAGLDIRSILTLRNRRERERKKEKERDRKDSRRAGAKKTIMGEVRVTLFLESILLLEGSQAMPVRPSDKDRMRVKTLGW